MDKIDRIDKTTTSLSSQMTAMFNKTSALEAKTDTNTDKIKNLNEEIHSLKAMVEKQNITISGFVKLKEEIEANNRETVEVIKEEVKVGKEEISRKTKRSIGEMQDLIEQQRDQADNIQATSRQHPNESKQIYFMKCRTKLTLYHKTYPTKL